MTTSYSKRALQGVIAVGGLIPVMAGLAGILAGSHMIGLEQWSTSLDSHYRYLSGLLLGIGIFFWMTIPDIEHKGRQFRLLTYLVVIGGCGRLWSLLNVGIPDSPMMLALVMELLITPLLALWQYQVTQVPKTVG